MIFCKGREKKDTRDIVKFNFILKSFSTREGKKKTASYTIHLWKIKFYAASGRQEDEKDRLPRNERGVVG